MYTYIDEEDDDLENSRLALILRIRFPIISNYNYSLKKSGRNLCVRVYAYMGTEILEAK